MFALNQFVLILAILVNFLQAVTPQRSVYFDQPGIIFCNNLEPYKGCRHEIGHKMDWDLGNPSVTVEFQIEVEVVVQKMWITSTYDDLAVFIILYPDHTPVEMYAAIYTYVHGDVDKLPKSLRRFYTNDPYYKNLYSCLSDSPINICDFKNISLLEG